MPRPRFRFSTPLSASILSLALLLAAAAEARVVKLRLVARPALQDLDGDGAPERVWTFNGTTPGPEIRAEVGDTVAVRFINRLPVPSSVHWHGVEVNNFSDGSQVSQNEVLPGGRFRYRFKVTRPGIYWYHPHIKPSNQVWRGLYGPLIVTDDSERTLTQLGVLPRREELVMLTDVTACKAPGENDDATFAADASVPWAGPGSFPGDSSEPTPSRLCETPIDGAGRPLDEPLPAGSIPNILPAETCSGPGQGCRVNMGQWVLTNGRRVAARAGAPADPGALAEGARPLRIRSGEGLRLRLVNAAIARYFRLVLTDADGVQVPLYRVGGEGGLLNRVRREGGGRRGFDTGYRRGEILLSPSDREDVVVVPRGRDGDVLTLWTQAYRHTGMGLAVVPTAPVLHIEIAGSMPPEQVFRIRPKKKLLADRRIDRKIEQLGKQPATGVLLDPERLSTPLPGTDNPTIRLTAPSPSIDDVRGVFDAAAYDDYRDIPHLASSRYARVGELLELEVWNSTSAHHAFHLHGFSFQPLRFERSGRTVFKFRAPEFVDTIDIPSGVTLVFRVRLADRAQPDGTTAGGAIGRWLLHCHILHHAALGMISELVVLPAE